MRAVRQVFFASAAGNIFHAGKTWLDAPPCTLGQERLFSLASAPAHIAPNFFQEKNSSLGCCIGLSLTNWCDDGR